MKTIHNLSFLIAVTFASLTGHAASQISSPDERIALSVDMTNGQPVYSVTFNGKPIIADLMCPEFGGQKIL